MILSELHLHQFRHFDRYVLQPHHQANFIFGPNGSGKSSLLEAIYVLAMGRSFRSATLAALIQYQASELQLLAHWRNAFERQIIVGLERQRLNASSGIRVDGRPIQSLSELVRLVPIQLINHDSFHLLDAGPQCRRAFLDWGVFHSEPAFYGVWQRYQRALKQRNAGLKRRLPVIELALWDQEMALQAERIHRWRNDYLQQFVSFFDKVLTQLVPLDGLKLQYHAGWDVEQPLQEVLARHYARDVQLGYSQHGPQRADLKIKVHQLDADQVLSRGQQKLVSYALRVAQSQLLKSVSGQSSVFLVDDLPAELDAVKIANVLRLLFELQCQLFVTAVDERLVMQACEGQRAEDRGQKTEGESRGFKRIVLP